MPFPYSPQEIFETIRMVELENLDIRTITLGISLRDCAGSEVEVVGSKIYDKIVRYAGNLVEVGEDLERYYGIPIINKRVAVTPLSLIAESCSEDEYCYLAQILDNVAQEIGVNFIGGYAALVHKGFTPGDLNLINSLPKALGQTERACAAVNIGTTKAGINMDAVLLMGRVIKKIADVSATQSGIGCTKLVVFCNAPEDNPFMAGAFHRIGEPECALNIGVSGPGVILNVVRNNPSADLGTLASLIKQTAFKVTRMGELIGRAASARLGVPFGVIDISLAPTPAVGDSVAEILEAMGLERCGAPGSTAALAILNDAVKKGGAMASSYVGGLSGAFIPVSEDAGMARAAAEGALTLEKLEAMTCVCSVGLDMIVIPGDTPAETIAALIADEAAIGIINNKTTAVRIIPAPGKKPGDYVEFGGLLGRAPVMPVNRFSAVSFVRRGGRIPAPLQALTN